MREGDALGSMCTPRTDDELFIRQQSALSLPERDRECFERIPRSRKISLLCAEDKKVQAALLHVTIATSSIGTANARNW